MDKPNLLLLNANYEAELSKFNKMPEVAKFLREKKKLLTKLRKAIPHGTEEMKDSEVCLHSTFIAIEGASTFTFSYDVLEMSIEQIQANIKEAKTSYKFDGVWLNQKDFYFVK